MVHEHEYLPFNPGITPARQRLPEGSWDCHFHVFEEPSRFAFSTPRSYTPTLATLHDYQTMAAALGIERAVLVQPSVYGEDHSLYEDVLRRCASWVKGVAVATEATTADTLHRWDALGTRGTRINALFSGGAKVAQVGTIIDKVHELGWHVQLLIDIDAQPELVGEVAQKIPVVVDHMGHFRAGPNSRGFRNLLSVLEEGQTWVKLSAPYRLSDERSGFTSLRARIDALVKANPDRLVWGSDWPHPAMAPPMVDDGHLADALLDWLDEPTLRKVLVDNPARLYR